MSENPRKIICLSGKRKCGKDYFAENLHNRLPGSVILRLSGPIKEHWAKELKLNFEELLSDTLYKEQYRAQMIAWSEDVRSKDPSFFCRAAIEMYKGANHPFWVVSDMRRKTDCLFFRTNFPGKVIFVRLHAPDEARAKRGFKFQLGVDDSESECGLDQENNWDFEICNDGHQSLEGHFQALSAICLSS
nr:EOG090X0FYC [Moina brachiata]